MEKVLRNIPDSVRQAKARGDYALLSALGKKGAMRRKLLRLLRKEEAERKAFVDAAKSAAFDADVEQILAAEYRRMLVADAYAHALRIDHREDDD